MVGELDKGESGPFPEAVYESRVIHAGLPLGWRARCTILNWSPQMGSVQIEQKSYEMPRERGSASHIFSPSPTSSDRLATTKRSSLFRSLMVLSVRDAIFDLVPKSSS
jgi:hypothetical protein